MRLLHSYGTCSARLFNNNNNNNSNIYRGSPTRQGGFQWGPHFLHMTDLMILQCTTLEINNKFWFFVILFSLAKNFEESYIESGGSSSSFCNKVFASWDYCISDENTAKVKSQNIVQTVRVSVCKINMNEGVRR